jgi:hypothetical protein
MDPLIFAVIVMGLFACTVLGIMFMAYKQMNRAMIFMKSKDLYDAQSAILTEKKPQKSEDGAVVNVAQSPEEWEDDLAHKQAEFYASLAPEKDG